MDSRTSAKFALMLCVFSTVCAAQSYPSKPIRLIVPFAPGGGVDLIGRIIAQKLQEAWGQPVIVDNRGGGGGNIGTDMVAKSPPDGHTLLMGYVGNLAINPFLFRKLPYDPVKDFSPISLAATAPNLLVAHPSVPASTVKDLVTLAKTKPGSLSYASAGNGTVGHMVAELFKSVTGIGIVHIPYKGNGPAVTDLLGGQVQLMFAAPGAVIPFVEAKKLKALAVASNQRLPELSDTATFAEAGYPGVEASGWYGVLTSAGTPRNIISALNKEIVRIMQLPDVKERLAVHGYKAVTSSPEEFAQLIKSDLIKWQKVVKASGAKVD
ncbi:MAG: tripartite tricarboxylate transporter substrate binding protein [Betaproteobacteria bacterium]|nr:tripartite tricarboxylate transporter substrate binding protein [Betaproteobacteria bacterium]MBI2289891.1 tripartite tricarboxylate transporter substrate binding protein [Betaproteobacteria bacterium]